MFHLRFLISFHLTSIPVIHTVQVWIIIILKALIFPGHFSHGCRQRANKTNTVCLFFVVLDWCMGDLLLINIWNIHETSVKGVAFQILSVFCTNSSINKDIFILCCQTFCTFITYCTFNLIFFFNCRSSWFSPSLSNLYTKCTALWSNQHLTYHQSCCTLCNASSSNPNCHCKL